MTNQQTRSSLRRPPKVTSADLDRAADFLQRCGAKIASVDVEPGRIKIMTTEGSLLPLDKEQLLDQELEEFRKHRG